MRRSTVPVDRSGPGRLPPVPDRPRCYREIRSARFPQGLPDRSDLTVLEAFGDAWLLIEHRPSGTELAGIAADYDAARVWLLEQQPDPAA